MNRFIKWKSKWFKDLSLFYRENGLIESSHGLESCNPSKVWINPKDSKRLRDSYYAMYKNEYQFLSKKQIESSVAMYMLNLEPKIDKGISEGYILIEE